MAEPEEFSVELGRDLTGSVLEGRYRVESVLGRGGMGTAYLAFDERMKRKVVVKVPHIQFLLEKGFRERFMREIESLTTLPHAHIVKVLDAGTVGGVPFAILEFLAGGSLKDRTTKAGGREAPADIPDWLRPVAKALDYIHSQRVVHRDVKPGNVLFDAAGNVFLADFGIAKALSTLDTGITQTGMTPGSPDYMAPEAVLTSVLAPTYDQYALGTMVYEALAGQLPHRGDTPMQVLFKKHAEAVPSLSTVAANVPAAAAAAVMRALEKDPAHRFPSCSAFAESYVAGLQGPPSGSTRTVTRDVSAPAAATDDAAPRRSPTTGAPGSRARAPVAPSNGASASTASGDAGSRRRGLPVFLGLLLLAGGAGGWVLLRKSPGAEHRAEVSGGSTTIEPGVGFALGPALPRIVFESPADASWSSSRTVLVKGRIEDLADGALEIEGRNVPITSGRFSTQVVAPTDGPLEIHAVLRPTPSAPPPPPATPGPVPKAPAVAPAPAPASALAPVSAKLTVRVDATPPRINLTAPAATVATISGGTLLVRGQVTETHLAELTVSSQQVTPDAAGAFEISLSVPDEEDAVLDVAARDQAGNTASLPVRTLRRDLGGRTPLHVAAARGDVEKLQRLIGGGAAIGAEDQDRATALHRASSKGQAAAVSALLAAGASADAKAVQPLQEPRIVEDMRYILETATPLHLAVWAGSKDTVDALLAKGADATRRAFVTAQGGLQKRRPSGLHRSRVSALSLAVTLGELGCAQALAARGGQVRDRPSEPSVLSIAAARGETAWIEALLPLATGEGAADEVEAALEGVVESSKDDAPEVDRPACARLLLAAIADPARRAAAASRALRWCNRAATAALLLDAGAEVDALDGAGSSALVYQAGSDDPGLVPLLLARGASATRARKDGTTPLHSAARGGALAAVEALLAKGADPQALGHHKRSALFGAAERGSVEVVQRLLAAGCDGKAADEFEVTVLATAAAGTVEVVKLLLDQGADPNALPREGYAGALETALSSDKPDILDLLLRSGANPRATKELPGKLLSGAARCERADCLQRLFEAGLEVSLGGPALLAAAQSGSGPCVALLLERGVDVRAADTPGRLLLRYAVQGGSLDAVKRLIAAGIDVKQADTPLYDLSSGADPTIVEEVLAAGYDPTDPKVSLSVLRNAISDGCSQEVQLLLARGVPADPTGDEDSGLALALERGNLRVARALLAAGANAKRMNGYGRTPLHSLGASDCDEALPMLLERGADLKAVDSEGFTPVLRAAAGGAVELLRALADRKVDLRVKDSMGNSALLLAADSQSPSAVLLLLDLGLAANEKNSIQSTPLLRAAEGGPVETLRLLLTRGAYLHAKNATGRNALHYASARGDSGEPHVRLLLEQGLKPDVRATDGSSALHLAAASNAVKPMVLLLTAKASLEAEDAQGQTPLAVALASDQGAACARLLLDAGADVAAAVRSPSPTLNAAIQSDDVDLTRKLVAQGADPRRAARYSSTAVQLAAQRESSAVLRTLLERGEWPKDELTALLESATAACALLLLERGADPRGAGRAFVRAMERGDEDTLAGLKSKGVTGAVALVHDAAVYGKLRLLRQLLDAGANPNARDSSGSTPLVRMATSSNAGAVDCARELLARGADPNVPDSSGQLPVERAMEYATGGTSVPVLIAFLERRQKDERPTPKGGYALLHLASGGGLHEVAKRLLDQGADVNAVTTTGATSALHLASRAWPDVVRLLLQHGADANLKDDDGRTPLYYAARGSVACVRLLLDAGADAAVVTKDGETLLHDTSVSDEEIVSLLLDRGAPVSATGGWTKGTPLHITLRYSAPVGKVRALLRHAASVTTLDGGGQTPMACLADSDVTLEVLDLMLAAGANHEDRDSDGRSLLHAAARSRDRLPALQKLLTLGLDVGARSKSGATPLHSAADAEIPGAVAALLAAGADVDAKDNDGRSPLAIAAREGDTASALLLLSAGASLDSADKEGSTPLDLAASRNEEVTVRALLKRGAKPTGGRAGGAALLASVAGWPSTDLVPMLLAAGVSASRTETGKDSAVHTAAASDRAETLKVLLTAGASPSAKGNEDGTPLHRAAASGALAAMRLLLEKGVPVDVPDAKGLTPLLRAAAGRQPVAIELLVGKGADPKRVDGETRNAMHHAVGNSGDQWQATFKLLHTKGVNATAFDKDGDTPLHQAAGYLEVAGLKFLLDLTGASLEAKDKAGRTLLHSAARRGNLESVQLLVARGASVKVRDAKGATPLHLAASDSAEAIASYLLEQGAEVNARDGEGATPLHYAADDTYRVSMLVLLLEKGADLNATDQKGRTPLDMAKYSDDKRKYLSSRGGREGSGR